MKAMKTKYKNDVEMGNEIEDLGICQSTCDRGRGRTSHDEHPLKLDDTTDSNP